MTVVYRYVPERDGRGPKISKLMTRPYKLYVPMKEMLLLVSNAESSCEKSKGCIKLDTCTKCTAYSKIYMLDLQSHPS